MRVDIPAGARMHTWLCVPPALLPAEGASPWPLRGFVDGKNIPLDRVPDPTAARAYKVWSEALSRGAAALVARDGAFRFVFDVELLPQIGLWVNARGWSGTGGQPYYNLALEPCIGAQDSLAEAAETYDNYGLLPKGGTREWWLEVHLDG